MRYGGSLLVASVMLLGLTTSRRTQGAPITMGVSLAGTRPAAPSSAYSRLIMRNLYLRNCKHPEKYYIHLVGSPLVRQQRDGAHFIDANVSLAKPVQNVKKLELQIYRCREAVSYNTCEYFTTWSWRTGLCQLIATPGMIWSPMAERVRPRIRCPIKEGMYSFYNGSWDVNNPLARYFEGFVWTGTFTAVDQDDVTAVCLDGAMVVVNAKPLQ